MIRVAINGFGRIGRRLFRLALSEAHITIVAINDVADSKTLSHLLKYDSIHGVLPYDVSYNAEHIICNGLYIPLTHYTHPKHCKWQNTQPDVVVECSGKFKTQADLIYHINNGAKRVVLSVPPLDDTISTLVLGVNNGALQPTDRIISNASCTTNNAAPMLSIIKHNFTVKQAFITTVHSYTTDQSLHDQPHRDLRRARAAGQSIVPTTTGAAKALTKIFPDLNNVIGGCGIRVPVANGSLTDMTINIEERTTAQEINALFKIASETHLKGILQYTEDPIVSVDIVGNSHSCVFDAQMTSVIGNMIKLVGWYDNETGYSARLLDVIPLLFKST